MSRIGRKPIPIPSGVEVAIAGSNVSVKGPRGALALSAHPDMALRMEDGMLVVERPTDQRMHRALHGLTRTLIANMVEGVTNGYSKSLDIVGVGYRAALKGADLEIAVGFSHSVVVNPPDGITFEVPVPTRIIVGGPDKQLVGKVAADIRAVRKPDPYKGKGIRYVGEHIRRKAGKAAK